MGKAMKLEKMRARIPVFRAAAGTQDRMFASNGVREGPCQRAATAFQSRAGPKWPKEQSESVMPISPLPFKVIGERAANEVLDGSTSEITTGG